MRRAVAAGSFDLLLLETINSIRNKYKDDLESGVEVLDKLGFDVGRRLVEKTSQDRNRFQNTLDVIKFLCKDFFIETFGKQVDNLRTNHRGVYVLIDQRFKWLAHISLPNDNENELLRKTFVAFPCGIIRGALNGLGLPCVVSADASSLPSVTFTLKMEQ